MTYATFKPKLSNTLLIIFALIFCLQTLFGYEATPSLAPETAPREKNIRALVTKLNSDNMQYRNHSLYIFHQPSHAALIICSLLTLLFIILGIAVLRIKIQYKWLQSLLWLGIGTFFAIKLTTNIDTYQHHKLHLLLTPQGVIKNGNIVLLWKNISSVTTVKTTIYLNFAKAGSEKEFLFKDQCDHTALRVSMEDLPDGISPDDFWTITHYFVNQQRTVYEDTRTTGTANTPVNHLQKASILTQTPINTIDSIKQPTYAKASLDVMNGRQDKLD